MKNISEFIPETRLCTLEEAMRW